MRREMAANLSVTLQTDSWSVSGTYILSEGCPCGFTWAFGPILHPDISVTFEKQINLKNRNWDLSLVFVLFFSTMKGFCEQERREYKNVNFATHKNDSFLRWLGVESADIDSHRISENTHCSKL